MKLVKLRFFARLTIEQAAQVLGIATSTAQNDLACACFWLRLEIEERRWEVLSLPVFSRNGIRLSNPSPNLALWNGIRTSVQHSEDLMATPKLDEADIFNAARTMKASEDRDLYVQQACTGDPALQERIEAMLRLHDLEPGYLETSSDDLGVV